MAATARRPDAVPSDLGDVTAAWLNACLSTDERNTVQRVTVQRIGTDYGFAGVVARIELERSTQRDSVVVKLFEADEQGGPIEARAMAAFMTQPNRYIPQCHYAAIDSHAGRGVVILSDLSDTVQGDCLEPADPDRALRLAEALAAIHGQWSAGRELGPPDWLPESRYLSVSDAWLISRADRYLDRFGPELSAAYRAFLVRLPTLYGPATVRLGELEPTLLHEDVHLDNVLFGPAGHPFLLDWANAARGPGILDVAALDMAAEPGTSAAIVGAYRAGLLRAGVPESEVHAAEAAFPAAVTVNLIRQTFGLARWEPASPRQARIIEAAVHRGEAAWEAWRPHIDR